LSSPQTSETTAAWRWALACCGTVVLVDQVAKAIIVSALAVGQRESLLFGVGLTNTTNRGLAFGIGQGQGFVLVVTIVALALVIAWFAADPRRPGLWLSVGLLVGGALGNLADRVRADAVTDFIDLPLWPAFNLADVAITVGALGLVLSSLGAAGQGEPSDRSARSGSG
jgi:signal peptidase II